MHVQDLVRQRCATAARASREQRHDGGVDVARDHEPGRAEVVAITPGPPGTPQHTQTALGVTVVRRPPQVDIGPGRLMVPVVLVAAIGQPDHIEPRTHESLDPLNHLAVRAVVAEVDYLPPRGNALLQISRRVGSCGLAHVRSCLPADRVGRFPSLKAFTADRQQHAQGHTGEREHERS